MSVTVRPYRRGGWEVDISLRLPDGSRHRERNRAPLPSKSAAQRWGADRERVVPASSHVRGPNPHLKEVPTLEPSSLRRFVDGHARANRQKPSGIAAKETILNIHLVAWLGTKRLDAITTEEVQQLKHRLADRAPKTVNNVLTVLEHAVEKGRGMGRHRAHAVRRETAAGSEAVHGVLRFRGVRTTGGRCANGSANAFLIVLLGGEAGLRCGEMMALEWPDVDLGETADLRRSGRSGRAT